MLCQGNGRNGQRNIQLFFPFIPYRCSMPGAYLLFARPGAEKTGMAPDGLAQKRSAPCQSLQLFVALIRKPTWKHIRTKGAGWLRHRGCESGSGIFSFFQLRPSPTLVLLTDFWHIISGLWCNDLL